MISPSKPWGGFVTSNSGHGFAARYVSLGQTLAEWGALVSMGTICIYVVLVTANVLMRYLFNAPMGWVSDMGFVFMPLAMAPCLAVGAARGMLISLTFLGDSLSIRWRRRLIIGTRIVSAVVLALIGWKMLGYGLSAWAEGRATIQTNIPLGPVWLAVGVSFSLAVPLIFAQPVIKDLGAQHG